MKEKKTIQYLILIYWTFFGALTVIDKIVPDVYPLWVGADFYTLFIKFFASLGISNPIVATIALMCVSLLEMLSFICYLFSIYNLYKNNKTLSEQWFYRGISFSILIFSLFSIGDQVFGDRFNLLEHGIFWIILIFSWALFKYNSLAEERPLKISFSKEMKIAVFAGTLLTIITSLSIVDFSGSTYSRKTDAVKGEEVVKDVFKFDIPFLGDKLTMENTIKAFENNHPEKKITYIYTGPDELNSKKKTHLLLYVFTEQKK
jgi:hypothetical protein